MGNRLKVQDALNIDDCRTMDTHKTNWVEPLGKLVQSGPVQHFLSPDVKVRVDPGSFDPVDLSHSHEAGRAARFHDQPVQRYVPGGCRGKHAKDALPKLSHAPFIRANAYTSHGQFKARVAEWLQKIVKRISFE